MVMLAILSAIAIPNYGEYSRRSHRSAVQAFISDVASAQAKFFLDRRTYATTVGALNMPVSAQIAERYTVAIAVVAGPPATFQVTATPAGPQLGDRCGVMTINQAGNRTAGGARCW